MMPSRPGTFVYGLEGRVLTCPWHHLEFDITTGATAFRTDVGRLMLRFGAPSRGSRPDAADAERDALFYGTAFKTYCLRA